MNAAEIVFLVSIVLLGYTYLGYPLAIYALALMTVGKKAPVNRYGEEPSMSLIVVAYNEADRITQKLENLLDLDYPWDRLEIIIASDGSTDATAELARTYHSPFVRVIEFKRRRGKSAVLNDVVPGIRGEIVVFADARQRFETGALRALADAFSDRSVGAVSGDLILLDDDGSSDIGKGVDFYWRYEKFIRRCEGRVDSSVGATGSIYAIRRALYRRIPDTTVLDDVLIPMWVVRQGYRVQFDSHAKAYDWVSRSANAEFTRKVRTIAGNFQLFSSELWLLNPVRNRLWLQTLSHKVFRLLSPAFLGSVFLANLALIHTSDAYASMFFCQVTGYLMAYAGFLLRDTRKRHVIFSVPYAFCVLNWATVVAFFRLIRGGQQVTWEKSSG